MDYSVYLKLKDYVSADLNRIKRSLRNIKIPRIDTSQFNGILGTLASERARTLKAALDVMNVGSFLFKNVKSASGALFDTEKNIFKYLTGGGIDKLKSIIAAEQISPSEEESLNLKPSDLNIENNTLPNVLEKKNLFKYKSG